jgi:hypothetical protein
VRARVVVDEDARVTVAPQLHRLAAVLAGAHEAQGGQGLLELAGGAAVDGQLDEGVTKERALAAVRAGNNDVEAAFALGATGRGLSGEGLYAAVREATGTDGDVFRAEGMIPRVSTENPPQNWQATDVESLWQSPMVGTSGATVGEALAAMLEPGGEFMRQVDSLGAGLSGHHGVFALPLVGAWLGDKCCQAYHNGFVEPLALDPQPVVLALVDGRHL